MKLVIKQKTADKLMSLYREMDMIDPLGFNQNDCDICLLGHGIHNGLINGYTDPQEDFRAAINWVDLPAIKNYEAPGWWEYGLVGDYLFGTELSVSEACEILNELCGLKLPPCSREPYHAQKRIEALLEAAGYKLTWNI